MINKYMIVALTVILCISFMSASYSRDNEYKPMVVLAGSVTNTMWPITDVPMMERSALLARDLGVDVFQTYTPWITFEPNAPGELDWTETDKLDAICRKTGLKWQAFIMFNPFYATPKWYRNSGEDVPHRCVEHNKDCDIRSIWTPGLEKHIERVLSAMINRYQNRPELESIMFGVSGDFGESLYPAGAAGWWSEKYHNHGGFWCAEEPAVKSFCNWLQKNYKTAAALNRSWGTSYTDINDVRFELPNEDMSDVRWLDQAEWYRGEMTNWCETWFKIARKYARPDLPLYLCTGGGDSVLVGFDITGQARLCAKYGVYLRLTSEGSFYPVNFMGTRQLTTAAKLYGIHSGLEPANEVTERGISARIFGAAAAGCNHIHYYEGQLASFRTVEQIPSRTKEWLREKDHLLQKDPYVNVAAFYPRIDALCKRQMDTVSINRYNGLRDYIDFDIVDDNLAKDGKLDRYRYILLGPCETMDRKAHSQLLRWVREGGILIASEQESFRVWSQFSAVPLRNVRPLTSKAENWAKFVVDMPSKLIISPGQPSSAYDLTGSWSHSEGKFRWGGKDAGMLITVDPTKDYKFTYKGGVPKGGSVFVNGEEIGTMEGGEGNEHTWNFDIPKSLLKKGTNMQIDFRMKPLDSASDPRDLCIYPEELTFETADGSPNIEFPVVKAIEIDREKLSSSIRVMGRGCIITMPEIELTHNQYAMVINSVLKEMLPVNAPAISIPDGRADGLFAACRGDEVLVYNSGEETITTDLIISKNSELDRYHSAVGQKIEVKELAPDHIESYKLLIAESK